MSASNGDKGEIRLNNVLDAIRDGGQKQRADGLRDLKAIFEKTSKAANIDLLKDKAYHSIFEIVFKVALSEKQNFLSAKKTTTATALTRLTNCADVVRVIIRAGAPKLRVKTVQAVVDHIIQTLPIANGDYCPPLSLHYLRALSSVLEHKSHVEHLKPNKWLYIVDFCLQGLGRYLEETERQPSGLARSSSDLGQLAKSSRTASQNQSGTVSRRNAEDLLQCLQFLVSAPNAPIIERAQDITDCILLFLREQSFTVSQAHQLAFSILNAIISYTYADRISLSKSIAQDVVPIICRVWQGKTVAKDEMLNSVKDEMLILLLSVHLHLERRIRDNDSPDVLPALHDLLEVMRVEYAKRSGRDRLLLEDIEMMDLGAKSICGSSSKLNVFQLKPHNPRAERNWSILQVIGILENLVSLGDMVVYSEEPDDDTDDIQPSRKRQRLTRYSDRLVDVLRSEDENVRSASLQILPFILQNCQVSTSTLTALLGKLSSFVADKRAQIDSWALLGIASCTYQTAITSCNSVDWLQIWRLGARAITISTTCRAASMQLHAFIAGNLVQYHDIGEDVTAMITSAPTSGPAIICDSAILLMMHLLQSRVTDAPSASSQACRDVIRWLFDKWKSVEGVASAADVYPHYILDILRTAFGLSRLGLSASSMAPLGAISQAWQRSLNNESVLRYLLLLDKPSSPEIACPTCPRHSNIEVSLNLDTTQFREARKLILELLSPKIENLLDDWRTNPSDHAPQISPEAVRNTVHASLTGLLLLPHLTGSPSPQAECLVTNLKGLTEELINHIRESGSKEPQVATAQIEVVLQSVQPYLPNCRLSDITQLKIHYAGLIDFFGVLADELSVRRLAVLEKAQDADDDLMDLDDDFNTQKSLSRTETQRTILPRNDIGLDVSSSSFYAAINGRLALIKWISENEAPLDLIPSQFVDYLLSLEEDELLSSRKLLWDILHSDLVLSESDAIRLVHHLGDLLTSDEFERCEIAQGLCVDFLLGTAPTWTTAENSLAEDAIDLYRWFMDIALRKNIASPGVQKGLATLLLQLQRMDPKFGEAQNMPSTRTSLITILDQSNASVKFYLGDKISGIFDRYLLKDHENLFVDVFDILPIDPSWQEGIAFRLSVISKLGATWSTLLRRCLYHVLETAGKVPGCIRHARKCLSDLSAALGVKGAQELFSLFAPQILFTWLENEQIDTIPYQIFGYADLKELLNASQKELIALMMMRGENEAAEKLAETLGLSLLELLRNGLAKTLAYAIATDISTQGSTDDKLHAKVEARVRKILGSQVFSELVNNHFADIVAHLFNIIDIDVKQEDNLERNFRKDVNFAPAADILARIRSLSASKLDLPPSLQPHFKARYFRTELQHLCGRTMHKVTELYSPVLVTFTARKIFNTIHPALGPLHSCGVLRKVRVLIAVSGQAALEGYPLEMLLQTILPFVTSPECAGDAIGILRYLLENGVEHLRLSPSFVAGIALSVLGLLRVFFETTQSPTTQESLHRATMTKAQEFHAWFGEYLARYESATLKGSYKENFRSMVQSAHAIRSVGNSEVGTPESNLLLKLLQDEQLSRGLLSRPSRKLALEMLSSKFQCAESFRTDIIGSDNLAVSSAAVVWKSCTSKAVSEQYLVWGAKVLGRAFAASGHVHQELLKESSLNQIKELTSSAEDAPSSRACILSLIQALTLGDNQCATSLAESTLRLVVSTSDEPDLQVCQQSLSRPLYLASSWVPYQCPPSEASKHVNRGGHTTQTNISFSKAAISDPQWARNISINLVHLVDEDILLNSLKPILEEVAGFAEEAFPFILHLVLVTQAGAHETAKTELSKAMKDWFRMSEAIDKNNLKLLINSILYLRTQALPHEKSSADRAHWLDIDYVKAAEAATKCGMFKTALLFVEESHSTPIKTSRRSSAAKPALDVTDVPADLLLRIFKNIDDPDMYYGVKQTASLSTILSRLEYERDGSRSLAFRGAQYDSHLRRHDPRSAQDAQSLVNALDVLDLNGLSHSLLQSQQTVGINNESLKSMFHTARKLEQWDIPVPSTGSNNAMAVYKTFQAVHTSSSRPAVVNAISEGFCSTMNELVKADLSASALHESLQSLAILTELDEVVTSRGSEEFEEILSKFQSRSSWMKAGQFDDLSPILSCRGTTLSVLSQQSRLRSITGINPDDTRLVEVQNALLSSSLNRAHHALQESLSLATSLMDLIEPCQKVGLSIEAAAHLEAANALWDQGEMSSSIGMLQTLDTDGSLKKQTIPVGRSHLLAKIGHQVSVAKLEKPDHIIENYLEPALKELRGKTTGTEAGQVFHQFAVFCDQQLEDPDGLEDLKRLEKLSQMKENEVNELARLYKTATTPEQKNKYKGYASKAKQWLKLDQQELLRQTANRDEFLRQSLENYLLALGASDEHDHNALRFTAMWLEHSDKDLANQAVAKYIAHVPSRKFASLMNQLTSRLLDNNLEFQQVLYELVMRICTDHPYHGLYHIFAGTNTRANQKDEAAISRNRVMKRIDAQLHQTQKVSNVWSSITSTNKAYCRLAGEKNEANYKGGRKIALKDSVAGTALRNVISRSRIPPPTMQIDIAADLNYSMVPAMTTLEPQMSIASGVSAPKIITAIASDGRKYRQLVKGGNDDLRQDAIMEQVFAQVSELLKANRSSRQRNLSIRTYKVLPLTASAGVIEFVPNTMPLHDYLMPAHERYYPKDFKGNQCRKAITEAQSKSLDSRVSAYRSVTEKFHPVMRYFFTERFEDPDEWFMKRLAYTRSTAAISILGHVLGLGDRHGHNILLDAESGEVVHIDLGVAFEMGRVLPVPELVPFRLTRDIVDGMGITKTEGVFRRCCEFTLEALRKEVYSISTILDVLRYDPLYSWSISPVRLAKLQDAQSAAPEAALAGQTERVKEVVNEPGEADRALTVVNKKLSKTLSVTATVNDLINQATDERNLAVLYSGWAAYA